VQAQRYRALTVQVTGSGAQRSKGNGAGRTSAEPPTTRHLSGRHRPTRAQPACMSILPPGVERSRSRPNTCAHAAGTASAHHGPAGATRTPQQSPRVPCKGRQMLVGWGQRGGRWGFQISRGRQGWREGTSPRNRLARSEKQRCELDVKRGCHRGGLVSGCCRQPHAHCSGRTQPRKPFGSDAACTRAPQGGRRQPRSGRVLPIMQQAKPEGAGCAEGGADAWPWGRLLAQPPAHSPARPPFADAPGLKAAAGEHGLAAAMGRQGPRDVPHARRRRTESRPRRRSHCTCSRRPACAAG
jgi:hypothetical protein